MSTKISARCRHDLRPRLQFGVYTLLIAIFLIACAPPLLKPPCANPVALEGKWDSDAPGVMFFLREGADLEATLADFRRRYGIETSSVFDFSRGFAVKRIDPAALAALRCEPDVKTVFYNFQAGELADI